MSVNGAMAQSLLKLARVTQVREHQRKGKRVKAHKRTVTDEYAPGIPIKGRNVPFPRIERKETWRFGLHKHHAKRAGKHYDLRIGDPATGIAYSWAIPKANFPEPGKVVRAIRTDDHTVKYMEFEGDILSGYGAGRVEREALGTTEIVRSRPDAIWFNLYDTHDSKPEELLLKRVGDKSWILMNLTVTRKTDPHIPSDKPKYKDTTVTNVDVKNEDEVVQPKLDGAHVLVDLRRAGKPARVYSYRKSKTGTHDLIDHTQKFEELLNKPVPKHLVGTMLRGEAVAVKGDKIQPASVTAGLLNSRIMKSRKDQQQKGTLQVRPFDVVREKKKDKSDAPYSEKLKLLRKVEEAIPELKVPETAKTPAEKARLVTRIKSGKHPDTEEGVVVWNKKKPVAVRAKLRPDYDVYVKDVVPGAGKYKGDFAGALQYSLTPTGPPIGTVGTGFSDKQRKQLWKDRKKLKGRVATLRAQGQFPSGALRAPSFYRLHPDK